MTQAAVALALLGGAAATGAELSAFGCQPVCGGSSAFTQMWEDISKDGKLLFDSKMANDPSAKDVVANFKQYELPFTFAFNNQTYNDFTLDHNGALLLRNGNADAAVDKKAVRHAHVSLMESAMTEMRPKFKAKKGFTDNQEQMVIAPFWAQRLMYVSI